MVVDQQIARKILAENMVIGQWYEVKGLIRMFEKNARILQKICR